MKADVIQVESDRGILHCATPTRLALSTFTLPTLPEDIYPEPQTTQRSNFSLDQIRLGRPRSSAWLENMVENMVGRRKRPDRRGEELRRGNASSWQVVLVPLEAL
jgi:hypothetical protein